MGIMDHGASGGATHVMVSSCHNMNLYYGGKLGSDSVCLPSVKS